MDAQSLIASLRLAPHPEGGHFREIYRDSPKGGGRGALTSIHYLLRRGEKSHWHRIDATEVWCFHAGAPLRLSTSPDGGRIETAVLGDDPELGPRFQVVVPPGAWQSAESLGDWTLVGCLVVPAFEFAGFEMAAPDWAPGGPEPAGAD